MLKRTAILLLVSTAALAEEPAAATKSATGVVPGRFDIGALDRSVDPCVDFYQFACGGWRAKNPVPPDQTRWGRFNELAERNREDLHQILEKAKDDKAKRSPLEAKVGDFYAACMDEAGIEARGAKPVAPALDRIAALRSKRELFELLGEHEASGLPTLFRFGSAPDLHDSTRTIASVGQGGIGLRATADLHHAPHAGSPMVSASPSETFAFWIAWPAAPFTRLSIAEKTRSAGCRTPLTRRTAMRQTFRRTTSFSAGGSLASSTNGSFAYSSRQGESRSSGTESTGTVIVARIPRATGNR